MFSYSSRAKRYVRTLTSQDSRHSDALENVDPFSIQGIIRSILVVHVVVEVGSHVSDWQKPALVAEKLVWKLAETGTQAVYI